MRGPTYATPREAAAAADAYGFSRVRTYAGWTPLAEWTPYGLRADEPARAVRFVLELEDVDAPAIGEVAVDARFERMGIFGRWPLTAEPAP